jgi:DNA-binding response OmpR family regulator
MSFAKQGYLVVSAPTTHDAMGLLRAPLSPIDLAVVNLSLPDVSGLHLCTYLRKSNPGLQLIVYSDEAEPSELPQLRKLGVNRFLQNPFTVEELIADVASLLHSPKQGAGGI